MQVATRDQFLTALLAAPRPGSERVFAFYDSRADLICTDPVLLLLPLDDHIAHRGDGLFESICYREGRIFALDAHLAAWLKARHCLIWLRRARWTRLAS